MVIHFSVQHRANSLACRFTGFPIIYQLFGMLGQVIDEYILDEQFDDLFTVLAQMLAFLLYTLSRLVLLVLPFLCLRSLPAAAFHVVHWVSFVPHL